MPRDYQNCYVHGFFLKGSAWRQYLYRWHLNTTKRNWNNGVTLIIATGVIKVIRVTGVIKSGWSAPDLSEHSAGALYWSAPQPSERSIRALYFCWSAPYGYETKAFQRTVPLEMSPRVSTLECPRPLPDALWGGGQSTRQQWEFSYSITQNSNILINHI